MSTLRIKRSRQKEQNNQQTARQSRMSVMLMGMAMMFSGQGSVGTSKRRVL